MLHIASSQKTFVRSVVNIVRKFGEMCARAHAHTLEGTLPLMLLHTPLANIFEAKKWAASFTCTIFKLVIEELL